MKIFLISPVRKITKKERKAIEQYVAVLKNEGHAVHLPLHDTAQEDVSGGYNICATNFFKINSAEEIHVWFKPKSEGSIFDLGMLFALIQLAITCRRICKRIVVANPDTLYKQLKKEDEKGIKKSFGRVLNELSSRYS